ncbi:hypothetical protein K504DRAFT_464894 [Pleomassaria siparia CBS 279.74]|uniref:Uncharacterized protein n=1 Tax=Pleomassaria siparia CBS 279.74 TaxID=1314801 RepID=A0A6G1JRA5_9PLEO|nr:hypothetical protein K504DRAFT_464894 [Pleomassaria siparia CBS 279.74]
MDATTRQHRDPVSGPEETTPLLSHRHATSEKDRHRHALYRALICAFAVSLSFGITQVPYVQVMSKHTSMSCHCFSDCFPKTLPLPYMALTSCKHPVRLPPHDM